MGARSRRRARREARVEAQQQQKGFGPTPPPWFPVGWWQAGMKPPPRGASAAVEACVSAISQTVAMLPIYHYRERADGGTDLISTSPAARVLRRPNNFQTRADFFVTLVRSELLRGNGYAVATRDNRGIDALYTVRSDSTHPYVENNSGEVFYQVGQQDLAPQPELGFLWPSRDVLHLRLHTRDHPLIGVTPLAAAASAVDTASAITGGIAAFMTNLVRPSGHLTAPAGLTMSPEVLEQLKEGFAQHASGGNQGKIAILTNGLTWTPREMDAFDEAIVKAYAMTTADIARVFRVPLPVINELGGATFNNSETLIRHWHATGLGFILEHIELALDYLFALPADEYVAFDVEYIMRTDFAARMDAWSKAVLGGIYAPNEARRKEGLPAADGGDEPRLQAQNVPLSAAGAAAAALPSSAPTPPVSMALPAPERPTAAALLARMRALADAS